jgi:hypothetical protein
MSALEDPSPEGQYATTAPGAVGMAVKTATIGTKRISNGGYSPPSPQRRYAGRASCQHIPPARPVLRPRHLAQQGRLAAPDRAHLRDRVIGGAARARGTHGGADAEAARRPGGGQHRERPAPRSGGAWRQLPWEDSPNPRGTRPADIRGNQGHRSRCAGWRAMPSGTPQMRLGTDSTTGAKIRHHAC